MTTHTILIVEDEPAISDAIQYVLETDGFRTLRLSAGGSVPAVLDAGDISLVILDIGLPDVNGVELCKRIRQRHDVPIIFLTARDTELDRVVGLEVGGDDYVTKPFSPRELSARVKAVLRRARPGVPENNSLFQVDEACCRVSFCGIPLELSRYEYRLLQTFLRRPGQVFSREKLMDLIWESPEASMDRTVDAHIKNIRAKLRAVNPDLDPILTHRGLGYSLRSEP